jgi:hypothetical protein
MATIRRHRYLRVTADELIAMGLACSYSAGHGVAVTAASWRARGMKMRAMVAMPAMEASMLASTGGRETRMSFWSSVRRGRDAW